MVVGFVSWISPMALNRRECEGKKTSWQRGSMEMDNSWDQDIIATFKNTLTLSRPRGSPLTSKIVWR